MKDLFKKGIIKEKMKVRKKGASHWLEMLGGVLVIVLIIGAFVDFDYSRLIDILATMLSALLDKAQLLWK